MKKINLKIVTGTLAIAFVLLSNSCTNLTNGLSTDPVNITNPNAIGVSQYLAGIQVSLIGVFEADAARLGGMWSGYFSGEDRQYTGLANYVTSGQDYDVEWGTIYDGVFKNIRLLKQNARPQNFNVAIGIAQVMEAMCLGLAADLWGDVPYTEAGQYPAISTPKFESQASVYAAAQSILDSALVNLTKGGPSTGDFLYGGDLTKWAKAAHTTKARLYLHTRDYANALAQAQLGIDNAASNLMAPHGSAYLQTFNLYYSFLTYDRSGYMAGNSYGPQLLDPTSPKYRGNAKTNENGRFNYYYAPAGYWDGLNIPHTAYDLNVFCSEDSGVPWPDFYGLPSDATHDGFFGCIASFPLLTFQENALILAEANAKLSNTQPAIDALNSLRAYYRTGGQFGVSTAYVNDPDLGGVQYDDYVVTDFAAGGIENMDNVPQDKALLREILEERFITLFAQIEGFNDMRRTGNYLNIPLATGKTDFPRRFLYSQIEINTNPNVPKSNVGLYDAVTSFASPY